MSVVNIDFPLDFDHRGRTATATDDDHIRQMIEQLLFTNPGERVNRPDFGSGLSQLVFAPNSIELAATIQVTMQAAIQRWLGDLVSLQGLDVTTDDATLHIEVRYLVQGTNSPAVARFLRTV